MHSHCYSFTLCHSFIEQVLLVIRSTLCHFHSFCSFPKRFLRLIPSLQEAKTPSMAGALVGGALLSAFLQVAFDRLASPNILDFFKRRKLNEKLLNKLNIMLLSINAVVDDAEQKRISNPNVKNWIDMVKDAVYEAEDVIDEVDYEASKHKVEAELQTSATGKYLGMPKLSLSNEMGFA